MKIGGGQTLNQVQGDGSSLVGSVGRKLRLLSELLRNSRILLLTHTNIGALRGFAKGLPRRGGSGRHDKVEQMEEVAWFKNRYFVALQTLRQAQGDGCLLLNFCHLRHLRDDSWLERGGDLPLLKQKNYFLILSLCLGRLEFFWGHVGVLFEF